METLNASDAKREFGEMLIKAQHEPIAINKNGKQVAVVLSSKEYHEIEEIKNKWLKSEIQKGIDCIEAGEVISGKDVIKTLRQRLDESI